MVWASAWPAPNSRISQNFAAIGDFFSALAAARPARRWPGPVELVDIGIDGDCREQIAWRPRGVGPALGVVAVFAIVRASGGAAAEVGPSGDADGLTGRCIEEGCCELPVVEKAQCAPAGTATSHSLDSVGGATIGFEYHDEAFGAVRHIDSEQRGPMEGEACPKDEPCASVAAVEFGRMPDSPLQFAILARQRGGVDGGGLSIGFK